MGSRLFSSVELSITLNSDQVFFFFTHAAHLYFVVPFWCYVTKLNHLLDFQCIITNTYFVHRQCNCAFWKLLEMQTVWVGGESRSKRKPCLKFCQFLTIKFNEIELRIFEKMKRGKEKIYIRVKFLTFVVHHKGYIWLNTTQQHKINIIICIEKSMYLTAYKDWFTEEW